MEERSSFHRHHSLHSNTCRSMFYIFTFLYLLLLGLFHRIWKRSPRSSTVDRNASIAIVGGGIGGVSAAYALLRSGYRHVTIYEAAEQLGGNAKTHLWMDGEHSIRTGLSVLAWPKFFRNYLQLLEDLKIDTTLVQLPFFIHHRKEKLIFAHGKECPQRYRRDLQRWQRMLDFVKWITDYLHGPEDSLYHLSFLNPFNVIPLRVLSFLFGVSSAFWNGVIVPMYASSFLSTRLSFIPASILPSIDRIVPLEPTSIPTLVTWKNTSTEVFDRLSRGATVKTNHRVQCVRIERGTTMSIRIDDEPDVYDRVIFACAADATLSALEKGRTVISTLLRTMLKSITYGDDEDLSLLDGLIHRDETILPDHSREDLLTNYANYIEVKIDAQSGADFHYNTFILSSWLPNVQAWREKQAVEPMLVTYAPINRPPPPIDPSKIVGRVNNRRAHPSLSFRNQLIALLNRYIQGESGMYFCGCSMTPANGHDLSLLSGLAVAEMIGAEYPFKNNEIAWRDYQRFQKMTL